MNRLLSRVILFAFLLVLFSSCLVANPATAFRLAFHGFVTPEFIHDSRQMVSGREGNVVLFPAGVVRDPGGADLNAVPSTTFSLLSSRFGVTVDGPELFGAQTSALMEVDFLGTNTGNFSMVRMRHAYVRFDWETTMLLAGNYWHPLFVPECFPATISFGAGAPYNILNRGQQLRLTQRSGGLTLSGILISQNDYASTGPHGPDTRYLRNSGKPEIFGQMMFERGMFLAGGSAGYKWLRPRTVTTTGYRTTEEYGAFSGNLFARIRPGKTAIRIAGLYGKEMTHLVMLGGYGEATLIDPDRNIFSYAGTAVISGWIDIDRNMSPFYIGLFCGYSKNLGTDKPITGEYWSRFRDVSHLYRLSPRAGIIRGKTSFNLELLYDVAAYGTPDETISFSHTENATGIRALATIRYAF